MMAGNEGRSSGFCSQHSVMIDARGCGVSGGTSKRRPVARTHTRHQTVSALISNLDKRTQT
jgi:hypothetical protein